MFPDQIRRLVEDLHYTVVTNGLEPYLGRTVSEATEAVRALRTVGAVNAASILKRATRKHESWFPLTPSQRRERFGDGANAGNAFDNENCEFRANTEDLLQLVAAYEKKFGL